VAAATRLSTLCILWPICCTKRPGSRYCPNFFALAKLQGAAVCYFYPASAANELFAELRSHGMSTDRREQFWGGHRALTDSLRVQAECALPKDLVVSVIDSDTPRSMVSAVAELCQSCDVMPVPGSVMRGQAKKGIFLVAVDQDGRPVATAPSYVLHHPSSPHATDVFWGMLATREDRRGERIALLLGAQAIVHMWKHHGARGFMTGVRADNSSSQAFCKNSE
jgi:hypothetical protein